MRPSKWPAVLEYLPVESIRLFHEFYAEVSVGLQYPDSSLNRALDFLEFQHRRGLAVVEISEKLLDGYIVDQARRFPNRSTRKHYRTALRHWLRFLFRRQLVLRDWNHHLEGQLRGTALRRAPLTYPDVKRVLQQPDLGKPQGILYRAILEVLYSCALRRGELLRLDLGDIDLTDSTVAIRITKNRQPRVLPLTRFAREMLQRYLVEVRPKRCQEVSCDALFLDESGMRLDEAELHSLRMALQRKLPIRFTHHQLRHSCATHLLQAGLDVVTVQAFLGHRNIETTQRYTHLTPTDLVRTHRAHHPRERSE